MLLLECALSILPINGNTCIVTALVRLATHAADASASLPLPRLQAQTMEQRPICSWVAAWFSVTLRYLERIFFSVPDCDASQVCVGKPARRRGQPHLSPHDRATQCEIRCASARRVPTLAMRLPATEYVAPLAMVRRISLGPPHYQPLTTNYQPLTTNHQPTRSASSLPAPRDRGRSR